MKKQFVGWIISKTQNQLLPTSHLSKLEILVLGYYKCTDSPIPIGKINLDSRFYMPAIFFFRQRLKSTTWIDLSCAYFLFCSSFQLFTHLKML